MSFVLRKVIWCFTSQVDLAQIFNLIIVASLNILLYAFSGVGGVWEMQTMVYEG